MKTWIIGLTILAAALAASPAGAMLDEVFLPQAAETGLPVEIWVTGWLTDACWILQGVQTSLGDLTATIEITLFYDNPDGGGCPTVLEPYDVFSEFVFPEPGDWIVRIVEHSIRPDFPVEDQIIELTLPVTGEVSAVPATFESVKALYR